MFYPSLNERIKAALADGVMLIIMMYLISLLFDTFEQVSDTARIIAFVFIFVLYDPLLTSLVGGTIGHQLIGIRVKKVTNEEQNIPIYSALLRFIVKAFLGWISLLTVASDAKKQALHDKVVRSVVLYK